MKEFQKEISRELTFMSYAPTIFISVLHKQRLNNVIDMVKYVSEKCALRVPTGQA